MGLVCESHVRFIAPEGSRVAPVAPAWPLKVRNRVTSILQSIVFSTHRHIRRILIALDPVSYSRSLRPLKHLVLSLALALMSGPVIAESSRGAATPRNSASPSLIIDKTSHDFGEVFSGEELMQVFNVQNVGDAPLELSERPILIPRTASLATRGLFEIRTSGAALAAVSRRAAPS
ncbi:MAG TPA: hypothetical protein VJH03_24970 [Blastocatellia bacterium]|nr:hypothetical protein [Blastocatellia bacterium]